MRNRHAPDAHFSARVLQAYSATGLPVKFEVVAAKADAPAEIFLYDEIGYWGVTAKDFTQAMISAGAGALNVRINSPGGDVFDGLAIYNALKAHPGAVTCQVDGLAASAASYIAMAGDKVNMAESSMMMIHRAWGVVVGNQNDMRSTAGTLEKIDGQMAGIYAEKTGKPVEDMSAIMDAETWLTAAEAKAGGFCDAVTTAAAKNSRAEVVARIVAEEAAATEARDALRSRDAAEEAAALEEAETAKNVAARQKLARRMRIAVAQ